MKVRVALLPCCLLAAGCAAAPPASYRVWLPAYALGAIGGGSVDMRDYCAPGAAREVAVGSSWATLGVSLATLGVYTPREVRVTCESSR